MTTQQVAVIAAFVLIPLGILLISVGTRPRSETPRTAQQVDPDNRPAPDQEPADRSTHPDQADPDQADPDQADPDQTDPDQTDPDQTDPDQTDPDQTDPDQTDPDQTGPDHTGSDRTWPESTRPEHAGGSNDPEPAYTAVEGAVPVNGRRPPGSDRPAAPDQPTRLPSLPPPLPTASLPPSSVGPAPRAQAEPSRLPTRSVAPTYAGPPPAAVPPAAAPTGSTSDRNGNGNGAITHPAQPSPPAPTGQRPRTTDDVRPISEEPPVATDEPPVQTRAPAPFTVVEARPFEPLVGPEHESTAQQRRSAREQAGTELDNDLTEVIRLIDARPPELRGMLIDAPVAVVSQELAVLRAFLRGALPGLDARLRGGDLRAGDRATVACLVSALRRLPVHHGAVFHRAPRSNVPLTGYFPGSTVTEPAFTRGDRSSFPAGGTWNGSVVGYVIWSESGHRTPLLAGHSETVVFTAATRFQVLAVDTGTDGEDATVFLAETASRTGARRKPVQILEHLRSRAANAGIGPIDGPVGAPVSHPGLDQRGHPFVARSGAATTS